MALTEAQKKYIQERAESFKNENPNGVFGQSGAGSSDSGKLGTDTELTRDYGLRLPGVDVVKSNAPTVVDAGKEQTMKKALGQVTGTAQSPMEALRQPGQVTRESAMKSYEAATRMESDLNRMTEELQTSYQSIQDTERKLQQMEQSLQQLQSAAEQELSPNSAAFYQVTYEQYTQMYRAYMEACNQYQERYRAYTPLQEMYDTAIEHYNSYGAQYVNADGTYNYEKLAQEAEEELRAYLASEEYAASRQRQNALADSMAMSGSAYGASVLSQAQDSREESLRALVGYYRNLEKQQADNAVMQADLAGLESWPEEDKELLNVYLTYRAGSWNDIAENVQGAAAQYGNGSASHFRATEAFQALAAKYGADTVRNYAETWSRYSNAKDTEAVKQYAQDRSQGFWGGVGGSIGSVAANLIGSISSPIGVLQETAYQTGRYTTLDSNNQGNLFSAYAGTARGTVAENIRGDGGIGREILATVYEAGMSALDNMVRLAVGGEVGSLALAATGAFGQTVNEASAQGASPADAIALGIGDAALEILTEKCSLDNLLEQAKTAPENVAEILRRMLTQAGVEVTEEEISYLGSLALEAAVLQEEDSYHLRIGELIEDGESYHEAVNTANREIVKEAIDTGIQSFLSGAMMSGAENTWNYAADTRNRRAKRQQTKQEAAAAPPETLQGQQRLTPDTGEDTGDISGRVSIQTGTVVDQGTMQMAGRLSEATGREVVFYTATRQGENGYFDPRDGKIYISSASKNPTAQIIGHELTHSIEEAGAYKELRELVFQRMEQTGMSLEDQRQELRRLYEGKGVTLSSQEDIDREVVARYVERNLLTDEASIQDVAHYNRSLAQRFKNWLDRILAKFQDRDAQERAFLERARNLYAKALRETQSSFTGETAPTVDGQTVRNTAVGADTGITMTGDEETDRQLRGLTELYEAGQMAEEDYREAIEAVMEEYRAAKGSRQTPEIDESWLYDDDDDVDFDDAFGLRLEDEEISGNAQRYSFGGENADGADLAGMYNAQAMLRQGVDPETIRRETGWHQGRDGKWRFEISDEGMEYDARGNMRGAADAREARQELKEWQRDLYSVLDWEGKEKVAQYNAARRSGDGETEQRLYRELSEGPGGYVFVGYAKALEWVRETAGAPSGGQQLQDYIDHPALFENYPKLRNVRVRFEEMRDGTRGYYQRSTNTIVLSEDLEDAPEPTLLHEIQHVIQDIEGFANGASPEYWRRRQEGDDPIRVADARIRRLKREIRQLLDSLPENIAAQFERYSEMEQEDYDAAIQMANELNDGPYGERFSEYFLMTWDLQMAEVDDERAGPYDLYWNTAGEIEARDSASRRELTPEQRKNTPPDLGGEETVFAEMYTGIPLERALDEYPYNMQTVIREYMDAADREVIDFVEDVRNGRAWKGKKITVGTVSTRMASDISRITGISNTNNAAIILNTSSVEHILRRHGENGQHDHSMGNDQDIARIGYVLQNYDQAERGRKKTRSYRNRDGSLAQTVIFSKKINGTYFVVEAVPDTGKVAIVSAYINKNGASQVPDDNTPGRDVRNELASTPVESVAQEGEGVKRYSISGGYTPGSEYLAGVDTQRLNDAAQQIFGTTARWSDTGWLTTDGKKLDFSDRRWGGDGGYRTEDHEEIYEAYPEEGKEIDGKEAEVDFMARGAVRILPESGGINLSTLPTDAQERALRNFITMNDGEVILDIDDHNGNTVASVEYPGGTRADRVLRDIRQYFKDGTRPQISDVQRFRYSISDGGGETDSDGQELTAQQRDYFRDSKARDSQGRLQKVYHGTQSLGFTVFDPAVSDDGISLFFSARRQTAQTYSDSYGKKNDTFAIDRETDLSQFDDPDFEVTGEVWDVLEEGGMTRVTPGMIKDRGRIKEIYESIEGKYIAARDDLIRRIEQSGNRALLEEYGVYAALETFEAAETGNDKIKAARDVNEALGNAAYMAGESTGENLYEAAGDVSALGSYMAVSNHASLSGVGCYHLRTPDGELLASYSNVISYARSGGAGDVEMQFPAGLGLYECYLNLTNPFELDCKGHYWNDLSYDSIAAEGGMSAIPRYEGDKTRDVTAWAKDQGYDGVIFRNVIDQGAFSRDWGRQAFDDLEDQTDTVYVAFSSEQVKSTANKTPTADPDMRYSFSGEDEVPGLSLPDAEDGRQVDDQDGTTTHGYTRETLPTKAREYLERAERKLVKTLSEKLLGDGAYVPHAVRRDQLMPIVREISEEYLKNGTISEERMGLLFDKTFAESVIRDAQYYDQYKDIKDYLVRTALTISRKDRADIADFNLWRKQAFGTLRIANEGGLPVDTAYGELRTMAPELFPESITHPADQLQHMYEIAKGIRAVEKNVREVYGPETERYRKWARHDFETAIGKMTQELRRVRRYADDADAAQEQEAPPATAQEAMQVYAQLKDARRQYEKAAARELLTPKDEQQVGRLLKGEISPEHLDPEDDATKGILAVYEAKQEYERLAKQIREYKKKLHGDLRAKADGYLETVMDWKDKRVGLAYSRETMRRNVLDIVPDRTLAKKIVAEYFDPVQVAEANATRMKNKYRDQVRALGLSTRVDKKAGNIVSEAHAVQLLGEALDNIEYLKKARGRVKIRDGKTLEEWHAVMDDLWTENPGLDAGKIEGAVREFRKIYDELFQQMNEVRVANGYEPVNYRKGYFPHFQPGNGDGILAAFGRAVGIDTQVAALPTTINGLTHTFKPGIRWFGNAQERIGFNTAYDAVEGFDKYIEGVAGVIHQTENIQKLRALASQIRYNASDEGIRKRVDEIQARTDLTEEEKKALIDEVYKHGRYALSNFVNELDEYTNLLANKKSRLDRTTEALVGRKIYTFMKNWENRVGANMIAGNVTSALTNFIPWTQAAPRVGYRNLLAGIGATVAARRANDGFAEQSDFLTNRQGSDPLVQSWADRASKKIGILMEVIDNITSESIVRAVYRKNLQDGLSESEALHQADVFAAGVMADRSKGAMPTLFESTNPIFKMFTQFQLEVNNQFSEVFKDLPREQKEKATGALWWTLLQYFIGAFLYNDAYEYFIGRRPALDPLGMLLGFAGDVSGYELPNLIELLGDAVDPDEEISFETERVGLGEAGANLAGEALGSLPFSSGLTLLGIETDGGRIPASSAVPDLTALWDAATEEGWSAEKRWKEVQDELNKLAYVLPPFGGNQIQKIWKGLDAYFRGGSYSVDAEGNDILQYPVLKDGDFGDFWTAVRAALLGKNSLPEAQEWVDSGFDSLNAKETAAYQDMLEAGVDDREAFDLLQELGDIEKTEDESAETLRREYLRKSEISNEGKAIVYYGLLASDSERELMDKLADLGAEQGGMFDLVMGLRDADALRGDAKLRAQYRLLKSSGLTDEEKTVVVGRILGTDMYTEKGNPSAYAKFLSATEGGLDVDRYMELRSEGASIDDYLGLTDCGIRPDDAADLASALNGLEPEGDAKRVSSLQQCQAIVAADLSQEQQMAALKTVMSENEYTRLEVGWGLGITPDAYVALKTLLPEYDTDGNGDYTQTEVKEAIDALADDIPDDALLALMGESSGVDLTNDMKAILWQLYNKSCSYKNNPYSTRVGEEVWRILNPDK